MQQYDREIFQFHKGTIKTFFILIYPTMIISFQFHKGTIKTCDMVLDPLRRL